MLLSHYRYGVKKAEFILKIRAVDFNDIVDIIWAAELTLKISAKLKGEKLLLGTLLNSKSDAPKNKPSVRHVSDKLYCTEPTTAVIFNNKFKLINMELNTFQSEARKTALYPNVGNNFIYPTLGLCGETGEIAEKIKKIIRDNNNIADSERINEIKKELGDVM